LFAFHLRLQVGHEPHTHITGGFPNFTDLIATRPKAYSDFSDGFRTKKFVDGLRLIPLFGIAFSIAG
jgi:hypothetical protein